MLDKLVSRQGARRDKLSTQSYRPEEVVTGRKFLNPNGQQLYVLFPPWHGGAQPYQKLARRLAAQNKAVLAYTFHDEILKPDVDEVLKSFQCMQTIVADELNTIADSQKYDHIRLISMSLGNPALAMVTAEFDRFDSASFALSATDLASSMWHGIRTQRVRQGIESQGYSLEAVKQAWAPMAPINNLAALAGKNIDILVSTADAVIPASYQYEYVNALRDYGIEPTVSTTRLGHYAAIVKFCLYSQI